MVILITLNILPAHQIFQSLFKKLEISFHLNHLRADQIIKVWNHNAFNFFQILYHKTFKFMNYLYSVSLFFVMLSSKEIFPLELLKRRDAINNSWIRLEIIIYFKLILFKAFIDRFTFQKGFQLYFQIIILLY